jgi:hypothetical protein
MEFSKINTKTVEIKLNEIGELDGIFNALPSDSLPSPLIITKFTAQEFLNWVDDIKNYGVQVVLDCTLVQAINLDRKYTFNEVEIKKTSCDGFDRYIIVVRPISAVAIQETAISTIASATSFKYSKQSFSQVCSFIASDQLFTNEIVIKFAFMNKR